LTALRSYVLVGAAAFILAALLTEAMRRIALRYRLMDRPGKGKAHESSTPYLGGVAIVISALAAWAITAPPSDPQVLTLIVAGTLVAALGLADDIRPARVSFRLTVEFLAAGAVVATGARAGIIGTVPGIGNWPDIVITVLWIVLMTNSFNLLDNSDGAAGGIAVVTAVALAVLTLAVLPFGTGWESLAIFQLAVSASCAGFLVHNWAPARIFMGDAGSLFLGFMTSASAVLVFGIHDGSVPSAAWAARVSCLLLLTFVAVVDTGTVIVSRCRAGLPLTQGGADHTSHRLRALGLRTSQAATLLSAVAAISCTFALLVTFGTVPAAGSLAAALTAGIIMVVLGQRVQVSRPARSYPRTASLRSAGSARRPWKRWSVSSR
jgi:UDP-GlcNAc:undecaprenyl-phosphate/decaprenyl-phosphate GlcNAc-1-phosphate transferase